MCSSFIFILISTVQKGKQKQNFIAGLGTISFAGFGGVLPSAQSSLGVIFQRSIS